MGDGSDQNLSRPKGKADSAARRAEPYGRTGTVSARMAL